MTIRDWLDQAKKSLLNASIDSAKLDSEIILAHTLRKSRTYLHAHSDEAIPDHRIEVADARIRLRLDRTPIAYIIGHKEFYGRLFKTTPATLIPRPESEDIITLLKEWSVTRPSPVRIVDVGTGTGCLGITAKLELPDSNVTLLDISNHALHIAEINAHHLLADVITTHSDLLSQFTGQADIIIANLPYVDTTWDVSPETKHEPGLALFADDSGLALIYQLLDQTQNHLSSNGIVLIEADIRQHAAIIAFARQRGLRQSKTRGLIIQLAH